MIESPSGNTVSSGSAADDDDDDDDDRDDNASAVAAAAAKTPTRRRYVGGIQLHGQVGVPSLSWVVSSTRCARVRDEPLPN